MMSVRLAVLFFILLVLGVSVATHAHGEPSKDGVTLTFHVRGEGGAPSVTCPANTRSQCRDDLGLASAFAALRRMAGGDIRSEFPGLAAGARVAGVEVQLSSGSYRLAEALVLSGWTGSSIGGPGPLHVRGVGGGRTVISGAVVIPASAWTAVAATVPRLPEAARRHVYVVGLDKLFPGAVQSTSRISGFGQAVLPVALEVFAQNRIQWPARWPNAGWTLVAEHGDSSSLSDSRTFTLTSERAKAWKLEDAMFLIGYPAHDWAFERIPIESVDSKGAVVLKDSGSHFPIKSGQRVAVEHALSELDAPGEWFFDRATQKLYFWPVTKEALSSVEVSLAAGLLSVLNSSDVTVSGMTFEASRGTGLAVTNSERVTLRDAVVRNMGNLAVVVEGGRTVTLQNLFMYDLGEGGVSLSGGDRQTLQPAQHKVEACRIERFSRLSRSYRPAVRLEGVGMSVLRNRISDGPHSAIVYGGNDHLIDSNHISNVAYETNDVGAIYTGRDWTTRGTVITNNLFQNIYPRLPGTISVMGVYLDDQASGTTVRGNVFANVTRAVFIGGGRDNVVEHNLFVASSPAIFADNRGSTWQREQTLDPRGTLRANLHRVPAAGELYRSRYPRLFQVLDDEPGRSKYNRATGNLFIGSQDFEFLEGAQLGMAKEGNRHKPWSVFKTLRGPKAFYAPQDFELDPAVLAPPLLAVFPSRSEIPP